LTAHFQRADTPCHQHQFLPFGPAAWSGAVVIRQQVGKADAALLKLQAVYHQAAILGVKDLHARQRPVHEDESLAVMHVPPHLVRHDAAQGVETFSHVRGVWIQIERIRLAQAEHGRQRKRVTNRRSWSSVMSLVTRTTTPLG